MAGEREGRQLDEVRQLALSYGEPDPSPDFPSPVTRLVPRSPTALSDSELLRTILETPPAQLHRSSDVCSATIRLVHRRQLRPSPLDGAAVLGAVKASLRRYAALPAPPRRPVRKARRR
jgi:hypothetical protein